MTLEEHERELTATISAISNLHLSGGIKAIGCVVILDNNDARTFLHHGEGQSFPLLAGLTMVQQDMVELLRRRTAINVQVKR